MLTQRPLKTDYTKQFQIKSADITGGSRCKANDDFVKDCPHPVISPPALPLISALSSPLNDIMTENQSELVGIPNALTMTCLYISLSLCSHTQYLNPHRQYASHCAAFPVRLHFECDLILHLSQGPPIARPPAVSVPAYFPLYLNAGFSLAWMLATELRKRAPKSPHHVASHSGLITAALIASHGCFRYNSRGSATLKQKHHLFFVTDDNDVYFLLISKDYY